MTLIAHASCDEHKGIKNGQAGDQTKKEVCTRTWYNKPWNAVIRFKDAGKREKIAQLMEKAAANDKIGYDQNQRNTLLAQARKFNYDVSKVTEPCETDCSALVTLACIYAGVPESKLIHNGNSATTRTLVPLLKTTGEVEVFTLPLYTQKTDKLVRGDILIKEGAHVVVVVKTDDNNPYFIVDRLLKRGSHGESVKWLQFQLKALNGAILNIDGVFGEKTEKAVIKYQEAKRLEVDGIAGEQTIKSLGG